MLKQAQKAQKRTRKQQHNNNKTAQCDKQLQQLEQTRIFVDPAPRTFDQQMKSMPGLLSRVCWARKLQTQHRFLPVDGEQVMVEPGQWV